MRIALVGRGKLGRAFERALLRADVSPQMIAGRRRERARIEADTVLLAVPDAQIHAVALALAPSLPKRACVLHCAGARGLDELAPLRERGMAVGVLHPLVSFASARHPPALQGTTFTTYGDRRAVNAARQLARVLGARTLVLPSAPGPSYHAAAALVANGAAALAFQGAAILQSLGFSARDSERALAGLLGSVANNVAQLGVPSALTGPVVRGDAATVRRHLDALRTLAPHLANAYAAVQPLIVDTARAAGLSPATARAILRGVR